MEYKYQLILLGSEVNKKDKILKAFEDKINDLKLPFSIIKIITEEEQQIPLA